MSDRQELSKILLRNIKKSLPELKELLKQIKNEWNYEDYIYRFYHTSFKVYGIQSDTIKIVNALKTLAPEGSIFNDDFEQILKKGTGHKFNSNHNKNWLKHTRPLLEAFFHAKYFLEMAIKYGKNLEKAPDNLPSGWAGLLYFYGLR
jgi:hypothetical protein